MSKPPPLEAGLDWLIDWQKPDFVGRAALLAQKQQGIERQLVGLELLGKGIARHGYPIYAGAQVVGGSYQWHLISHLREGDRPWLCLSRVCPYGS